MYGDIEELYKFTEGDKVVFTLRHIDNGKMIDGVMQDGDNLKLEVKLLIPMEMKKAKVL